MANLLDAYIPEIWVNESVAILVENMVVANLIHRNFSSDVARFGDIVHTRKPGEFTAKRKVNADSVTIQDATAADIQVPLDQHIHTSFMIKDGEETKSFKQLRDEYLFPAVLSIARSVDQVILGEMTSLYVNGEGIAGGLSTTNIIKYIVETRKRLNINKAPEQDRSLILTPDTEAIALQTGTFHEADKVGDNGTALREASLGRKFQFNTFMCQNASNFADIPANASQPLVDLSAGYPIGTTTFHVDTAGSALAVGQWLSVGGALHRVTALGTLATQDIDVTVSPGLRVAVADDDPVTIGDEGAVNLVAGYAAGTVGEIAIDAIVGSIPVGSLVSFSTPGTPNVAKSGVYSVVETTDSGGNTIGITLHKPLGVALADDDVVQFAPPAQLNPAFHRNAITMVSRPLAPAPAGLALSAVANFGGVGIRITMTYDGNKQGTLVTADLLCGIQTLDTNLGGLLIG